MIYLVLTFWFWLLLALALGVAVAWFTFRRDEGGNLWSGLLPWGGVLLIGGLAAASRILPMRAGYWLDLAWLMLAAYLIGCLLAAMARRTLLVGEPAVVAERVMPAFAPTPIPNVVAKPAPKPTLVVSSPKEVPVEPMKPGTAASTPVVEPIEQAMTGLSGPRNAKPDDLTQIYGIDAGIQAKLNDLGLYHVDQLAVLTPGQRRWLFRQLGHEGRFPSWWWRWRYDAEQILAGRPKAAIPVANIDPFPVVSGPKIEALPAPSEPVSAPSQGPLAEDSGSKPAGLEAPRGGKADDLKRIKGIGKQNEGRLHGLGIWHFEQVAAWTESEVKWVGSYLAFPGRIEREDWVGQAKILATGGVTEFARRADAGEVQTSRDDTNDDGQGNVVVPITQAKRDRKTADDKKAAGDKTTEDKTTEDKKPGET